MNQALTQQALQHPASQTPEFIQPNIPPTPLYAVCYIDKFSDPLKSQAITYALGQKFKLNSKATFRLASGQPVIVKRATPMKSAYALKSLIDKLGGCCWVQQLDASERFHERRQGSRRASADRRDIPRTNIEPDRRGRQNRRLARNHSTASEMLIFNSALIKNSDYNDIDPKCDRTFGPKYDRKRVQELIHASSTANNKYQDNFSQQNNIQSHVQSNIQKNMQNNTQNNIQNHSKYDNNFENAANQSFVNQSARHHDSFHYSHENKYASNYADNLNSDYLQ